MISNDLKCAGDAPQIP